MEEYHLWYNYRSCGCGYNEDGVGSHGESYGKCDERRYKVPSFFVLEDYVGCLLLACSHGVLTRHCTIFDANVRDLYVDM